MASFSKDFRVAYHVLPLHLWKPIRLAGAILPKKHLRHARPTTAGVDVRLGFENVVHFYLAQGRDCVQYLPILQAQLRPSRVPPFPHVALELATQQLDDQECIVCNWNIAVSRPGVPGVCKGGNWTRGTAPDRIREVWDAFRSTAPNAHAARGYFRDDWAVPVLAGSSIKPNLKLLKTAPRKMPELMLEHQVPLTRFGRLITFSNADADLVRSLAPVPIPVEIQRYPGYTGAEAVRIRRRIARFFRARDRARIPRLDYDRVRPAT